MKIVTDASEIHGIIEQNDCVFLYFSGENCSVCKALKPKIEELFSLHFPQIQLIEIPTDNALETTAQFGIFSLPTMLLFVEKKEFFRKGRNVSLALLRDEVKRVYTLFLQKE
ncbi:MAG: thioredoxin family protein [Sulfurimonadaceae bacterium]